MSKKGWNVNEKDAKISWNSARKLYEISTGHLHNNKINIVLLFSRRNRSLAFYVKINLYLRNIVSLLEKLFFEQDFFFDYQSMILIWRYGPERTDFFFAFARFQRSNWRWWKKFFGWYDPLTAIWRIPLFFWWSFKNLTIFPYLAVNNLEVIGFKPRLRNISTAPEHKGTDYGAVLSEIRKILRFR